MSTTELRTENVYPDNERILRSKFKRILYYILGTMCLVLGAIGIFFPILPTTPFLLLAAACYIRSSQKAYNWLLKNKIFGQYIRNYREGKGMPIKIKLITLTFLWITIVISMVLIRILWVQILLIIIASGVSIHILLIRPKKRLKSTKNI
jgi:uncharacterized membrane protein YbaN (DUF454 family)